MNMEQLEAQSELNKVKRKQLLKEEFDNLRPTWKDNIIRIVSGIAIVLFITWKFPEMADQPVFYALVILILGVSGELHLQCQKINKRIDVLHKILND